MDEKLKIIIIKLYTSTTNVKKNSIKIRNSKCIESQPIVSFFDNIH